MSRERKRRFVTAWVAACLALAACAVQPIPSALPSSEPTATPTPTAEPDRVAPMIVLRHPAADGVIATTDALRVTFSEPVRVVDASRVELRAASGSVVAVAVTLNASRRTAALRPMPGLTVATSYTVALAGGISDDAGNALKPSSWSFTSATDVTFEPGPYTGYRFDEATGSRFLALRRATLDSPSTGTAAGYRIIGEQGYLLMAGGEWDGYLVHGSASGTAQTDDAAPVTPLPPCDHIDLPTARPSVADWATTVLDTIFQLPAGYAPPDLVSTAEAGLNGGHLIRELAVDDLSALVAAAKAAGARLTVQSAYRSYRGQVLTFNGWVAQVGYDHALQTSARPGHSEHQLGTAIDFRSVGGPAPWQLADWATTTEGKWMAANAWRFGWVMSYEKGRTALSCYRYEPWHYRYLGRQAAAAIHAAGIPPRAWMWGEGYGIR